MKLRELYEALQARFGERADPDRWWPVYHGRSDPPQFERALTNILVQNSNWRPVKAAADALDARGLLTAGALAGANVAELAECARPTGLQAQKAQRLKALGEFVVGRFQTEAAFCATVTRGELLELRGLGEETADRTLLYACLRLAWPVDTYCLRVLTHYGVLPALPVGPAEKRRSAAEVKQLVEEELPRCVDDWRRLHALMQLEGEGLRERGVRFAAPRGP